MSRKCFICGKHAVAGRSIARRGLAKKKGGVGRRITGVTKRVFAPNIRRVRTLVGGQLKKIRVCAKCLKAGKVEKIV